MTKEETKVIIQYIIAAFPNFKPADLKFTLEMWSAMLVDYEMKEVELALKMYITSNTSGFAPSIGSIVKNINLMKKKPYMSEMEAWSKVRKALENSLYHSEIEFKKLSPEIQRVVANSENLKEWALMDAEKVETVVQSNFMRSYKAVVMSEENKQSFPREVQMIMENNSDGLLEVKEEMIEDKQEIPAIETEKPKKENVIDTEKIDDLLIQGMFDKDEIKDEKFIKKLKARRG